MRNALDSDCIYIISEFGKMESKAAVIRFLKDDHQKLVDAVTQLKERQMVDTAVIDNWVVKDIIAHISAWNWEIAKAIDLVLTGNTPWYVYQTETEFNKREIEARRSWSVQQVLEELYKSFAAFIKRIETLSDVEWKQRTDAAWRDGSPVTVSSLFVYRYLGEGHEGGHAKQIRSAFRI